MVVAQLRANIPLERPGPAGAEEALARRLATGEIDEEEYPPPHRGAPYCRARALTAVGPSRHEWKDQGMSTHLDTRSARPTTTRLSGLAPTLPARTVAASLCMARAASPPRQGPLSWSRSLGNLAAVSSLARD